LSLNRLSSRQGAEMITQVTGGKALPKEIADEIVDRTDGVPLFLEELTKNILEGNLLRDQGDRYGLVAPLPPLAIPMTLQDSLVARLDRLSPVKEVAQTAAVIGRNFSQGLLAIVMRVPQPALEEALAQLIRAELIFPRTE